MFGIGGTAFGFMMHVFAKFASVIMAYSAGRGAADRMTFQSGIYHSGANRCNFVPSVGLPHEVNATYFSLVAISANVL